MPLKIKTDPAMSRVFVLGKGIAKGAKVTQSTQGEL
jgi:hypothetical protein